MPATTVVTVTNTWTEVVDILETTWQIQNVSDNLILVNMNLTSPAAEEVGHILMPGDYLSEADLGVGDVWVRNGGQNQFSGVGTASAITAGTSSPKIAITK